jgi:hypothetical protein
MPDGMISPREQPPIRLNRGKSVMPEPAPPGLGRVAPYETGGTIVCPVCETDQFTRLDLVEGSGKCLNKHHVMRRDTGVWYCPDTSSGPPSWWLPRDGDPGFESVRIMRLQPDDVIILQFKDYISSHQHKLVMARMKIVFPDHKAVIVDGGAEVSIARPDADLGSVKPNPETTKDGA